MTRLRTVPAVLMGDLTLVRPLALAKIPFILVTTDPADVALRSRFVDEHLIVGGWDDTALPPLIALGERLRARHGQKAPLFCGSDAQLEFIYRHRDELGRSFALAINDPDLAWALHDKSSFYALCEDRKIPAPHTLHDGEDPDAGLQRLREPILVKPKLKADLSELRGPLFGTGKARVFETRASLTSHPAWASHKQQLIVQEHIEGDVGDLVSFHGFADEQHRLLGWFCGKKVRTFPSFGGESAFIELVHDPVVEHAGRELVGKLGLVGPFKVDFVRDAHGVLWTLEINARFTLWCYLGAVSGVNLLEVAYDHLVSGEPPLTPPHYETDRRWLSLYRDANAFREHGAELGVARWLRSIASPRNVFEVFAWDDPVPFVSWVQRFVTKKLRA